MAPKQYYGIKRQLRFIRLSGGTGDRSREAIPSDLATHEDVISPDWVERNESTALVVRPQAQGACGDVRGSVLTEARGRDEIAESVADYFYQNAERVALFLMKGRTAAGWKAHIRKKVVEGFENFQLALDEPSALKVVADTRSFYLGPIVDTAGNQKLLAALGGGAPESALLMPLMTMGRIVMIFYLDGGKELAKDLESLLNTADMAGLASEILHFSSSNSAL